jgi:AcrR family transcriptional regulator
MNDTVPRSPSRGARKATDDVANRPVRRKIQRDITTREQWLAAARRTLIHEGVNAVKIDRLAKMLNVSRGGFYWRFSGHTALLDALLDDWRDTNVATVLGHLSGPGEAGQRLTALARAWIDERNFDPKYDTAIRDWARSSRKTLRAVQAFDKEFIDRVGCLLQDIGTPAVEANLRARIFLYHQAGYYSLRPRESRADRHKLLGLYLKILTGFEVSEGPSFSFK